MTFGDNNDEKYSECVKIIEETVHLLESVSGSAVKHGRIPEADYIPLMNMYSTQLVKKLCKVFDYRLSDMGALRLFAEMTVKYTDLTVNASAPKWFGVSKRKAAKYICKVGYRTVKCLMEHEFEPILIEECFSEDLMYEAEI